MILRSASLLAVAALVAAACMQEPGSLEAAEAQRVIEQSTKPLLELPRDLEGLEALGLAIPPESSLVEGQDGLQMDETGVAQTIRAKFYTSSDQAEVARQIAAKLESAFEGAGTEGVRVVGKNRFGDEVDVMIGPTSARTRTLVLAWIRREKLRATSPAPGRPSS